MADLDGEVEATTRAYVGAAVTEIATFRAELSGPQVGRDASPGGAASSQGARPDALPARPSAGCS